MTSGRYRVGIVGASEIAAGVPAASAGPLANELMVSHAASLALTPAVEVVGVCDVVPELLDRFKRRWETRWPNVRLYSDYGEMLGERDLDIVTVATPDHLHADVTVDAANAGVKGVYCEKPLATSLEDADRMLQACESNGAVLSVNHTRRWSPLYHEVREAVRSGAIGPLGTVVATLGGERALLFRNGTHLIDSTCFFTESDPETVFASLESGFEDWDRYRGEGGRDAATEPGTSGFIQFRNGVRALYSGTKGTAVGTYLQLSGPRAQINIDDWERAAQMVSRGADGVTVLRRNLVPRQFQVQGMAAAYREMIDLIENGGAGVSSGREARKTVQVMEGFVRSSHQGGRLIPVPP